MSVVTLSFLLLVILLGALWFHDVWYPPEGRVARKQWSRSLDRVLGGNKRKRQHVALLLPPNLEKETR